MTTKPLTPRQEAFCRAYLHFPDAQHFAAAHAGVTLGTVPPPAGFYTYLLVDPADGSLFYVGKGKGDRMRTHAKIAGGTSDKNGAKVARIRMIQAAGRKVVELVFSTHEREAEALAVEKRLIEVFRDGLTNMKGGNVSALEAAFHSACNLYDRVLPIDRWMKRARKDQLAYAERIGGTAEAGYEMHKQEILHTALHLKALMDKETANENAC